MFHSSSSESIDSENQNIIAPRLSEWWVDNLIWRWKWLMQLLLELFHLLLIDVGLLRFCWWFFCSTRLLIFLRYFINVVPMLDTTNHLINSLSLFSCIFGSVNETFVKFIKNFMNVKTQTKYTHFQTQLFSLRCVVPYKVSV